MRTRCVCLLSMVFLLVAVGTAQAELVSHWRLDEGAGTVAYDSGPGGNNGDFENEPTWTAGVYGGAVEFHGSGSADGTGDRINCGSDASLDIGGEVSLAMWIRPDADGPEDAGMETAPLCKALSGASPSWTFQVRYGWGSSSPYMAFTFNTSPRAWAYVGQNLEQGEWCHIACSYDGSTLTCYLNGEETESTDMGAVTNSPTPVLIGSDGWGSDWIGLIDDVRYYSNALTAEEIVDVMFDGSGPEMAGDPVPDNETIDVSRDTLLSWTAGEFAATHDVYLGTVFDDVNEASRTDTRDLLVSQDQADTTYDPGRLEFGQTYYWRVDEVNAAPDSTIFKGEVWSFSTELLAYPIEAVVATTNAPVSTGSEPENMVNGSGLDEADQHGVEATDMWLCDASALDTLWIQFAFDTVYKLHEMVVWNYNSEFETILGFGVKGVTVEYSADGVEWTSLGDAELAQGTGRATYAANTAVDLQGVAAQYVRLTVTSGYGTLGQYGLSEVRFLSVPVQAREPQPAAAATDVDINTELSWRAGREAASHEVYLGNAADALALAGTVTQSSYAPADLEFGKTYYWKVTEVNEAEAISSWAGSVWSFTVQEYGLIEDFEAYDDDLNRIYDTWIDGWVNGTGSIVGYATEPFAEQSIVHGGDQSLPLEYDNSFSPYYSEASRTWASAQDWTAGGAVSLRLYFYGETTNEAETLYVAVEDSAGNVAVVTHADASAVQTAEWQGWTISFSALTDAGVNLTAVATVHIGLGDRDNPASGGAGIVYVDDVAVGTPSASSADADN